MLCREVISSQLDISPAVIDNRYGLRNRLLILIHKQIVLQMINLVHIHAWQISCSEFITQAPNSTALKWHHKALLYVGVKMKRFI